MSNTASDLDRLLSAYSPAVREIVLETRRWIAAAVPGLTETVDAKSRVVGYGFGTGYADLICTIILSKDGAKLGIVGGAELDDPYRLMEGSGKRHRYVTLEKTADLRKRGLESLLKRRVAVWEQKQ